MESDANAVELSSIAATDEKPAEDAAEPRSEASAKPMVLVILPLLAISYVALSSPFSSSFSAPHLPLQRSLLEESSAENTTAIVFAQIVAWVSTFMYLACRVPQIFRNVRSVSIFALTGPH